MFQGPPCTLVAQTSSRNQSCEVFTAVLCMPLLYHFSGRFLYPFRGDRQRRRKHTQSMHELITLLPELRHCHHRFMGGLAPCYSFYRNSRIYLLLETRRQRGKLPPPPSPGNHPQTTENR